MDIRHGSALQQSDAGFIRMFPLPGTAFKEHLLAHLAGFLTDKIPPRRITGAIPAGYTYFGQFVNHDISLLNLAPAMIGAQRLPLDQLEQGRSSSLDLDSLYGTGLDDTTARYTDSGCFYSQSVHEGLLFDLPRPPRAKTARAQIPDQRNDENFLVAQMHVFFMNLHNCVMRRLESNGGAVEGRFNIARQVVTLAYQQVIEGDYLRRILTQDIWQHLFDPGAAAPPRTLLQRDVCEEACVPIEFTAAAFRFGHSMVLPFYDLNDKNPGVSLAHLFSLTGLHPNPNSIDASIRVDWQHLFPVETPYFMRAARIEPVLTKEMTELPMEPGGSNNLIARNLLRSRQVQLPCAQDIIAYLQHPQGPGIAEYRDIQYTSMTDYFKANPPGPEASDNGLDIELNGLMRKTPLWLYVLAEASQQGSGKGLGPLGSIIVGETLRMLILCSRTSLHRLEKIPTAVFDVLNGIVGTERAQASAVPLSLEFADLVRFVKATTLQARG